MVIATFKPRLMTACLIFTDASHQGHTGFILKHLQQKVVQENLINLGKNV